MVSGIVLAVVMPWQVLVRVSRALEHGLSLMKCVP